MRHAEACDKRGRGWVCDTLMLAPVAGAGAFYAAPETPHAFCPKSAGFMRFGFAKSPPAVVFPPRRRPAAARGGSPRRLPPRTPPCRRATETRAWLVVTLLVRRLRLPHADAFGCARGLMLALRSLNARGFRAFLRRFKYGGAKSLPCGLRARRRPPRIIGQRRLWAALCYREPALVC